LTYSCYKSVPGGRVVYYDRENKLVGDYEIDEHICVKCGVLLKDIRDNATDNVAHGWISAEIEINVGVITIAEGSYTERLEKAMHDVASCKKCKQCGRVCEIRFHTKLPDEPITNFEVKW
jgi:ferredoxin